MRVRGQGVIRFPVVSARQKGLPILVSRRMQAVYPRAIALVDQGIIDVRTLVLHRCTLREVGHFAGLLHSTVSVVAKRVRKAKESKEWRSDPGISAAVHGIRMPGFLMQSSKNAAHKEYSSMAIGLAGMRIGGTPSSFCHLSIPDGL